MTRILAQSTTEFQEMAIVESGLYGKALVLDGKWQSCTGDEFLYHEPLVHPALIAHGDPKKVLVLGGGEGATHREILRWKGVEKAVMVDIDGEVVAACREHLSEMHQGAFDDPRFELVVGDALAYLDATEERFDVVISDLSDPIEEGPSFRLFTKEYFEQAKRVLAPEGIFVVQAGPTAPVEMEIHCRLVNTLRQVWPSVVHYTSHVASYGSPWGFAMGRERPFEEQPAPEVVDRLLAEKTTGGLRAIDGRTLLGLLQTPAYLRRAAEAETVVYTLERPPRFFGQDAQGHD